MRQLVYGIRADQRHFGYTPVVYLMSEHAMHSQIPQLLADARRFLPSSLAASARVREGEMQFFARG